MLLVLFPCLGLAAEGESGFAAAGGLFKQYCFECHGSLTAEGQMNLEQMTAQPAFDTAFKKWEKVAAMLEAGKMPPKDASQPTIEQRRLLMAAIREELTRAAEASAGDPGQVVLRRLTSAEYAYAVQDLTGLDLDLGRE